MGNAKVTDQPERTEPNSTAKLARIYREHASAVVRYTRGLRLSEHDADDICAEVFLRAARCLDRCPNSEISRPWLLRVARNCVIDGWRYDQRWRERLEATAVDLLSPSPTHPPEPDGEVRAALEALRPDHRRALVFKYVEGRSAAEIGRLLGRKPAAIDSMMRRARSAFRANYRAGAGHLDHPPAVAPAPAELGVAAARAADPVFERCAS